MAVSSVVARDLWGDRHPYRVSSRLPVDEEAGREICGACAGHSDRAGDLDGFLGGLCGADGDWQVWLMLRAARAPHGDRCRRRTVRAAPGFPGRERA